jgi:hypothetical protein
MPTSGKGSTRTNTGKTVTKPQTPQSKADIKAAASYKEQNGGVYRLYYKANGRLDRERTKRENV